MSVLSGYSKYKRYILTSSGYKLCSHWTSSNTVHFDDGKTAQTKVGAINGITDSLTSTSSNVALSSKAGKSLQDQVTQLNTGLDGMLSPIVIAFKDYDIRPTVSNSVVDLNYDISDLILPGYIISQIVDVKVLYTDGHRYQQVTIANLSSVTATAKIMCLNTVPFKIRIYALIYRKSAIAN